MPKKLIEVALPLEAINAAAGREKSIRHGHPSTLHLWWARRPLAAARAVLFAQLVDDPSTWPELKGDEAGQKRERERLFRLIERMVPWEASHDEAIINEARREIAQSHARFHRDDPRADVILGEKPAAAVVNEYLATALPPVHDPFAGGGTIPLEAQRLGLRAIATDLNPVAVLINKALIEIPPKFAGMPPVNPDSQRNQKMRTWKGAEGLAEDVRYYGIWMREEAIRRIGHLYPKVAVPKDQGGGEATAIAWVWARTVRSPEPRFSGVYVPLVTSYWLDNKAERKSWVVPVVEGGEWRFLVDSGVPRDESLIGIGTKRGRGATFVCVLSGALISAEYIRSEALAGRMKAELMAVVAERGARRFYVSPSPDQIAAADCPVVDRVEGMLPVNPRWFSPPDYGMQHFSDLYSARQSLAMSTLCALVREAVGVVGKDCSDAAYAQAVGVFLGLAVSRLADYNSTVCTWNVRSGQSQKPGIRNVFSRQAIAMSWDYAEANPLCDIAGSLVSTLAWVTPALSGLPSLSAAATVRQADVRDVSRTDTPPRVFSTDPPYYDNIGYADLSDYFYVWQRKALGWLFPDVFATILTPKVQELIADPYRHQKSRGKASEYFEVGMRSAFGDVCGIQRADFPLTIYYAFKQSEEAGGTASTGWEKFLEGVLGAGLSVMGTWPMRTERGSRLVGNDTNALASSIVLVCRKRADDAPSATRSDFLRALKRTLPRDLKLLQQGNIAPVDFAQAAIGPGMAVFSSYAKVLESDGSAMSVRTALQIINQVLDEVLSEQEGDFDADTRCALAWFEQHQYGEAEFGSADTLARAKNTSVAGLVEAGVLRSSRGKVALLTRAELSADWDPATDARRTVWEVAQHLIRALEAKGERAAGELLARVGAQGEAARELAYRLYSLCERKKWAAEALAYNGLVTAWPEVAKLAAAAGEAASVAETPAQGGLPGMG